MNATKTIETSEDHEMKILIQHLLLFQVRLEYFDKRFPDFELEVEHLDDAIEFLMESLIKRQYLEE